MKYKVIRIKEPLGNLPWDEILAVSAMSLEERRTHYSTEFIVEAETPFDAAVSAEGTANGYTADQMDEDRGEARTRREQIEDRLLHYSESPKYGLRRTDGGISYSFDHISTNGLIVYEL